MPVIHRCNNNANFFLLILMRNSIYINAFNSIIAVTIALDSTARIRDIEITQYSVDSAQ